MAKDKKKQEPVGASPTGISTKGYRKPTSAPKSAETPVTPSGMTVKKKKTLIAVTASALAAVLIVTAILIGVSAYNNNFDYLEYDLSRYISFEDGGYKDYPMSIAIAKPHEKAEDGTGVSDLELSILDLIYQTKYIDAVPVTDGITSGATIAVGDRVYFRYRAYYVDSEGKEIEITGYNNFHKDDDSVKGSLPFAVGDSLGFDFAGLSSGLLGVNISEYAKFSKKTEGAVEAGEVVYISCERTPVGGDEDDREIGAHVRINLADEETLALWDDILVGKSIGSELEDFNITVDGKEYTYSETTVEFSTTCEEGGDKPVLTVEAYVPYSSNIVALRNETVYLDVYVYGVQKYNTWHSDESEPYHISHDWNDEFVTGLLEGEDVELTEEELAEYEGATLTEKFESWAYDSLMEQYELKYDDMVEDAIWDYYLSVTKVKKYPKVKVEAVYEEYYKDVIYQYETSGGTIKYTSGATKTYDNLDDYAVAYLSLSGSNVDWEARLHDIAENMVKERLILYYIMKEENLIPTQKELNLMKEQIREEYVEEGIKQDKTDTSEYTEEQYEEYVEGIRRKLFAYYDDAYFTEQAYYEIALKTFRTFADVTTLDDVPSMPQIK